MACIEYECPECDFFASNNRPFVHILCPDCGCVLRHSFDEENDHDEEEKR